MSNITLNRRELYKLYELFNTLNVSEDWGTVTLYQNHDSGIGSVLTATFVVEHKDIDGEFTVTISDESNW